MDFDSHPATLTVPQDCLAKWTTQEFEDHFLGEIWARENMLPLNEICKRGGNIVEDTATYKDLQIYSVNNGVVNGSFAFSFTEEVPTTCKDIQHSYKQSGVLYFMIDLRDGLVTFQHNMHHAMSGE